jgi:hypothetical protein
MTEDHAFPYVSQSTNQERFAHLSIDTVHRFFYQ